MQFYYIIGSLYFIQCYGAVVQVAYIRLQRVTCAPLNIMFITASIFSESKTCRCKLHLDRFFGKIAILPYLAFYQEIYLLHHSLLTQVDQL